MFELVCDGGDYGATSRAACNKVLLDAQRRRQLIIRRLAENLAIHQDQRDPALGTSPAWMLYWITRSASSGCGFDVV